MVDMRSVDVFGKIVGLRGELNFYLVKRRKIDGKIRQLTKELKRLEAGKF